MDKKVLISLVDSIPRGKVISYGELAAMCGNPRASRWCARVLSHMDEQGHPCHRVVHADGSLCPNEDFGAVQKRILLEESVYIKRNGKVDRSHWWKPL